MKRTLLLLLLVLSTTAFAQKKGITFKVKFLPGTEYTTIASTYSKVSMNIDGEEEKLSQIKASGVALPMILESKSSMSSTTTTGLTRQDASFPATITYEKVSSHEVVNGEKTINESPLSGLVVKGNYNSNNKFEVDTLISDKINESLRNSLKSTFENIQHQTPYPDEPMKIGDSFEQKLPMSIPVVGMNPIKVVINTTYKLKGIKGDIAVFDIIQDVKLDMPINESNLIATGSGTGASEFDIKKSFMTKFESDMDMNLTVTVNNLTITSNVHSKSIQQVRINNVAG